MRPLWVVAALLISAGGVALIVSDDTRIAMILVIAGSAISPADRYRTRNR